jgi:hypothetical protein
MLLRLWRRLSAPMPPSAEPTPAASDSFRPDEDDEDEFEDADAPRLLVELAEPSYGWVGGSSTEQAGDDGAFFDEPDKVRLIFGVRMLHQSGDVRPLRLAFRVSIAHDGQEAVSLLVQEPVAGAEMDDFEARRERIDVRPTWHGPLPREGEALLVRVSGSCRVDVGDEHRDVPLTAKMYLPARGRALAPHARKGHTP